MKLKTKPTGIFFIEYEGPDATGAIGRRRVSLDTRNRAEARKLMELWAQGRHPKQLAAAAVRADVSDAPVKVPVPPTGLTVSEALSRCLTSRDVWLGQRSERVNRSNVKALEALCGGELLSSMDYERVGELIAEQLKAKVAPGTIGRRLSSLSTAVKMACIWKDPKTGKPYMTARPLWPKVTVENERTRVISVEEEAAIFRAIEARREEGTRRPWWLFGALITILRDTGLRLGEACKIEAKHIRTQQFLDPRTGELRTATFLELPVYTTKSKKPRRVPLTPAVLALRPALDAQACKGRWFPWQGNATTPWSMWDTIRGDVKEEGFDLSDAVIHTWRHTCATRLLEKGMDIFRVCEWLGHHDIKITQKRYGHLAVRDLLVGLDLLAAYSPHETAQAQIQVPVSGMVPPNGVMRAKEGLAH